MRNGLGIVGLLVFRKGAKWLEQTRATLGERDQSKVTHWAGCCANDSKETRTAECFKGRNHRNARTRNTSLCCFWIEEFELGNAKPCLFQEFVGGTEGILRLRLLAGAVGGCALQCAGSFVGWRVDGLFVVTRFGFLPLTNLRVHV